MILKKLQKTDDDFCQRAYGFPLFSLMKSIMPDTQKLQDWIYFPQTLSPETFKALNPKALNYFLLCFCH